MKRLAVVIALVLAVAGTALAAPARNVDLLKAFAGQIPKVKKKTAVAVLLPSTLPLGGSYKVYATSTATANSWLLDLSGAPNCGGANACFVATFEGKRGGRLPSKANVRLAGGDPAVYHHFTCGGSCSPSSFWFTHGGVLYTWQAKDLPRNERPALIRMANDAIAAGPR